MKSYKKIYEKPGKPDNENIEEKSGALELTEEDFEKEPVSAEEAVDVKPEEEKNASEENVKEASDADEKAHAVEESRSGAGAAEPASGPEGLAAEDTEGKTTEEKPAPQSEKEAKKERHKPKKKLLIWTVSISLVLLLLIGGLVGFGIYASRLETVFPNVFVEGENLSGLTREQALDKLNKAGRNRNSSESKVTIMLPLNRMIVVFAHRVDANITSEKMTETAFRYCHSGNVFADAFAYIRSFFGNADLSVDTSANTEQIKKIIGGKIDELIKALTESGIEIGEDSICIVKGAESVTVDKEAIIKEVGRRFKNREYGEFRYEPKVEGSSEFDENALYEDIHAEVSEAYYDRQTREIVPEVVGRDFDKTEARRLWETAEFGATFEVPLTVTKPKLTAKEIEAMLYRDVLGESTTSFAWSTANRINNITLACEAINGKILQPGETFSYNDALGPRTEKRGYKLAGVYSGGEVVQGYGGGICQISSSLYTCVLLSDLKVVERECHYFRVGYLPPAQDATVSWGHPDFKFTNDTDYPIMISAEVNPAAKTATLKIIGTNVEGGHIELSFGTWFLYKDPEYPEVATGMGAVLYKSYFDKDGNFIKKEQDSRSEYHFHPEDIKYPEPSPSPESPEPTAPPATPEPTPSPSTPEP